MDSQLETASGEDNLFSKVLNGMKTVFNNSATPKKFSSKKNHKNSIKIDSLDSPDIPEDMDVNSIQPAQTEDCIEAEERESEIPGPSEDPVESPEADTDVRSPPDLSDECESAKPESEDLGAAPDDCVAPVSLPKAEMSVVDDEVAPKPRIVLKFRSEKSGLRSSNMKIVSDEREPDVVESDDSPRKRRSNPSDSNSEDSPIEKNSIKRSARRRSREFSENVLANAIARKEKIYNEAAAGHTRLSRRIKPTAKILANRELRIGLETQNSVRLGLVLEKPQIDPVKLTRSKLKKSPDKNRTDPSDAKWTGSKPKRLKPETKRTPSDDEKSNPAEIVPEIKDELQNTVESQKIARESADESGDDLIVPTKGRNEDDKRINKLKKRHLKKLGLKAVGDFGKRKDKENVTDESTMDSTNTEAIIEHLNDRIRVARMKPPEIVKTDEPLPIRRVKKFRNCKAVKRKLSMSDSEDSPRRRESEESEEDDDIPVRITRKRSKMGGSNDLNDDNKPNGNSSVEDGDSDGVISCYCAKKSNLYADPESLSETEFCRAVENIGNRIVGCGRAVVDGKLSRAGPRAPFILTCSMHRERLALHQSCAGCGIFCTQGAYYQCSEGHLFHWECGLPFVSTYVAGQTDRAVSPSREQTPTQPRGTLTDFYNSDPGCPHCGLNATTSEPINTDCYRVELEMKCKNPMILLPSPRLQWNPAFMSFTSDKSKKDSLINDELSILPDDLLKLLREAIDRISLTPGSDESDCNMDLIKAVCDKENTIENIVSAINGGADPRKHITQVDEGTFLHLAARELNLSALHIFRMLGCDLNDYDVEQRTPLMLAVMNYDTEVTDRDETDDRLEIAKKSDEPDEQRDDDEEPSSPAVFVNKTDKSELVGSLKEYRTVIEYLLKAGSDVTLKGPNGATVLHLAAKFGDILTCSQILKACPKHFINHLDDGCWTPLVWAVENKCNSVVRYLLDNGADPALKDSENNTALHWAAATGSSSILEDLLNSGSDVNAVNVTGDTPLHLSARQNNYNCLVILLARGAMINLKNSSGETALQCADENSDCHTALTVNIQLQTLINRDLIVERTVALDISNGKEVNPVRCVNSVDEENLDGKFVYVSKNCFTMDIDIDKKITSMQACQCDGVCGQSDNCCACVNLSMQCWYDGNGKLVPEFDYRDPPMIFECSDLCSCNKIQCWNRCLSKGPRVALKVFRQVVSDARGGGWGVCAAQAIDKGTLVCEYVGEILPGSLAYHRDDDSYLFELQMKDDVLQDSVEPYCIDAKKYGNVSRFINHKCEPNLVPVRVFVDHQDLHFPRIAFFASKNINVGEELGFDYGPKFWGIKIKSFTCSCNSRFCRYGKRDSNYTSDPEISECEDLERAETDN